MPGGSTPSLGLSVCIACIPSFLGTSAACLGTVVTCLGRADCLGKSAASLHYLLGVVLPIWKGLLTAWEKALSAWN